MESIWQKEIEKPTFDTLEGELRTDVLVIGGGLTGILCGYLLKNAGIDSVVVEGRTICGGVTGNTTAKVTYHHGAIFDRMLHRFGPELTGLYLRSQQEALEDYRRLAQEIDCDFEETTSFVYSRTNREKMEKEAAALHRLGCPAQFTKELPLPFSVAGAVMVSGQAQFHPLKFAYALAKELRIYENTEVLELKQRTAVTQNGRIRAEKVIVATHFPLINRYGLYFMKLYQHRSYVLALENAPALSGMYVDETDTGLSFRMHRDQLLLGGGGHRTGKPGGGWQELQNFASVHYPEATEVCRYATQDCKTLDDLPYIGPYSPSAPGWYVATGFNKWGMTNAMAAAKLLTEQVQGKATGYGKFFSPARTMMHPQLLVNAGESVAGLLRPTVPRCSHLGCALKYNKQEHTWDCGCHGSRFNEEGRRLDYPARKNIKPTKPPR